jgi:hypothetical protein
VGGNDTADGGADRDTAWYDDGPSDDAVLKVEVRHPQVL